MTLKRLFWSLHLPRKTYRDGREYYGTFPEGFLKNMHRDLPEVFVEPILHLCCGTSTEGDIRIDIRKDVEANVISSASHIPLKDGSIGMSLIDPYYTAEDYGKVGQLSYSVYRFIVEAARVVRSGGYLAVLHTHPPRRPKGWELHAIVAISMGPDRQLRMLQVWKKP